MSTIAEKLCGDIVNPVLEQSSASSHNERGRTIANIPKSQNASSTRAILIDKRRVNNIVAKGKSPQVVIKCKTRETGYNKVFTDKSINTVISGPLTSNVECLTNIRKRTMCTCGGVKKLLTNDVKDAQTSKTLLYEADKSFYYCYGPESCKTRSTQLFDISDTVQDKIKSSKSCLNRQKPGTSRSRTNKPVYIESYGAKRWSVSKYPKRGPDF